jgi:hypothetical protein
MLEKIAMRQFSEQMGCRSLRCEFERQLRDFVVACRRGAFCCPMKCAAFARN